MTRGISRTAVVRLTTALAVVAGLMSVASPAAAHRCAGGASSLSLRGFAQAIQPYFYFTPEAGDGTFLVGGAIDRGTSYAHFSTQSGSPLGATPGSDYTNVNGTLTFENDVNDCLAVEKSKDVPVTNDNVVDAGGVEELLVHINVQNASAGVTDAPMYIVDDEGPIRARLPEPAQSSISEPTGSGTSTAKIPVLRAGSGGGSITWSINDPGNDVSPDSGTLGSSIFQQITLNITNDTVDEPNETLTLTLSATSPASVEGDNTFSLTILDNDSGGGGGDDDEVPPVAVFHHPDHGARYKRHSFQADTIHLFVTERPDHLPNRISSAQVALRKKMTNGNCKWWSSGSWQGGPCSGRQWITVQNHVANYVPGVKDLFIYEAYPSLPPSVGTRVKNYTVFGRAFDIEGNESPRVPRRNVNTFEVKRR